MSQEMMTESFLIKYSNNKRKKIEYLNSHLAIKRKSSLLEQYLFNFVPVAITSAILSPLNRIKIILQVQNTGLSHKESLLSPKNVFNKIISEQGIAGLWKGNYSYTLKIFLQSTSRIVFYDRIKHWERKYHKFYDDLKFKIPGAKLAINVLGISLSCLLTIFLTYPFDLASAKIMSDIGNKETMKYSYINDVFAKTSSVDNKIFVVKYYQGVSLAILETFPQGFITLFGSQIIYRYHNLKLQETDNQFLRYWKLFGCMATLGFVTSAITYPFNTIKRKIQVHNSVDLTSENRGVIYALKYMRNNLKQEMFRGFSMHCARMIPFSILQYQLYYIIMNNTVSKSNSKISSTSSNSSNNIKEKVEQKDTN